MAFAVAYEAARDVTHRGIHFHGGYGFMMEQDIQLYYRRVRGWANVFGDTNAALDRVASERYCES
jgi:alkylation response protein AidB-like acyl-CoA dehydrogenase